MPYLPDDLILRLKGFFTTSSRIQCYRIGFLFRPLCFLGEFLSRKPRSIRRLRRTRRPRKPWKRVGVLGWGLPQEIVERWETKAYALLAFLCHPKCIRRYLYTTNLLERLVKEVKRRTKVVEVFCGEGVVESSLFGFESARRGLGLCRLRGFA